MIISLRKQNKQANRNKVLGKWKQNSEEKSQSSTRMRKYTETAGILANGTVWNLGENLQGCRNPSPDA